MLKKRVLSILMISFILPINIAFANKVQDSTFAKGIKALLDDLTAWLPLVSVGVGVVAIIICLIMRSWRDEMEKKKWSDRIGTAISSTIGAVIASSFLRVILSYFGYVGQ